MGPNVVRGKQKAGFAPASDAGAALTNIVPNGDFETAIGAEWVSMFDAETISRTTSSPLTGTGSLLIALGASGDHEVEFDGLPAIDGGQMVYVGFEAKATSGDSAFTFDLLFGGNNLTARVFADTLHQNNAQSFAGLAYLPPGSYTTYPYWIFEADSVDIRIDSFFVIPLGTVSI